jgi:hypothetical protein
VHENEIRFIHSPSAYSGNGRNYLYKWEIGENEIQSLGEIPPLIPSSESAENIENDSSIDIFPQPNGYLSLIYTQDSAMIRFDDGDLSYEICSIERTPALNNVIFNGSVDNMVYDGDDWIAMMVSDIFGVDYSQLVLYQISTDDFKVINDMIIEQIAPYLPGELLIYNEGAIKTYTLNNDNVGPIITFADGTMDSKIATFAFDHNQGILYYLFEGDLYRTNSNNPHARIVVTPAYALFEAEAGPLLPPSKAPIKRLLPLPNGQIVYEMRDALFIVTPIVHIGEGETLQIHYDYFIDTDYAKAVDFYHLVYPHVSVEINCASRIEYYKDDKTCDVLVLAGESNNLQKLFREGYAAPLSNISVIEDRTDSYILSVQQLLCYEGVIMAVPAYMTINPWFVNISKWEEHHLPDIPQTIDELFSIIDLWSVKYASLYPNEFFLADGDIYEFETCLLYLLTRQYMFEYAVHDTPLRFDTPEYISLLNEVFALSELPIGSLEDGYPLLYGIANYPYPYMTIREISNKLTDVTKENRLKNLHFPNMGSDYTPIMPISLRDGQMAKLGASLDVFVMHPDSPNPMLAKEFLSLMASHPELNQNDLAFMLSPTMQDIPDINDTLKFFYIQHIDDLSFSAYALQGYSMYGNVIDTLGLAGSKGLEHSGFSQEEAKRRIIDVLNHLSLLDWRE